MQQRDTSERRQLDAIISCDSLGVTKSNLASYAEAIRVLGIPAQRICYVAAHPVEMPSSIQDILDYADELAERFEDYEPEACDERPVEEYLLERAALARARSEREIVDAITTTRAKNVSWQRIGELLGASAQAAQQRYGNVINAG